MTTVSRCPGTGEVGPGLGGTEVVTGAGSVVGTDVEGGLAELEVVVARGLVVLGEASVVLDWCGSTEVVVDDCPGPPRILGRACSRGCGRLRRLAALPTGHQERDAYGETREHHSGGCDGEEARAPPAGARLLEPVH
mgnify:CR=1 FL=1